MFSLLTHKQKFRYLLFGTGILMLFIYILALKPTIELKKKYRTIKQNIETSSDAPQKIVMLENQLLNFRFLFNNQEEGTGNHEKIHEFISLYCQKRGITFSGYPPLHTYNEQNYVIETNIIELEGDYIPLLKLLYEVEKNMNYGKVVSVQFISNTNLRTKTKKLGLKIYIQHIIQNQNEK